MSSWNVEKFGLKPSSRIKAFVFRYVSVAAKWIKTARRHMLNIYTDNMVYDKPAIIHHRLTDVFKRFDNMRKKNGGRYQQQ